VQKVIAHGSRCKYLINSFLEERGNGKRKSKDKMENAEGKRLME
jgi:hypothetical protein